MKTKDGGPLAPIYTQAADGKLRAQERGITLRTYLVKRLRRKQSRSLMQ